MAKKQPQPDQVAPQDGALPTHIIVTSSQENFWRGGLPWSKAPTKIELAELTQEQIDSILREPMLAAVLVCDEQQR